MRFPNGYRPRPLPGGSSDPPAPPKGGSGASRCALKAEPGDMEFPSDPAVDPLSVRFNGRLHVLGKKPYRLLRWVYWRWITEGRVEFDFIDLALHVWEDGTTRTDAIETAIKRLREFLVVNRAAFSVRYDRGILYIEK